MKFSVYVLLNDRGKYYIGHTNNISRRIDQHNDSNRKSWASKYGPWKLIYHEICQERSEAVRKEKYLKSFKNKESLSKYLRLD